MIQSESFNSMTSELSLSWRGALGHVNRLCLISFTVENTRVTVTSIFFNKSLLKKAPNEHYGLSRKDRKRPDGLTLTTWKNGKCLIWDFTCADTLCQSSIKQCSKEAGAAAEIRKKIKIGQ